MTSLTPKPEAATVKPTAKPPLQGRGVAGGQVLLPSFTIQVGAFKDKATADSVVTRLKGKGFAAYLVAPESDGRPSSTCAWARTRPAPTPSACRPSCATRRSSSRS